MRSTRLVAAILLAAFLPACTSYQVMADPASGLQTAPKPIKDSRVTLRNGYVFELHSPHVDGDSLRGTLGGGTAKSVAMADVAGVEVRKTSTGKTVALVAGVVVGVALIAGVIFAISCNANSCLD